MWSFQEQFSVQLFLKYTFYPGESGEQATLPDLSDLGARGSYWDMVLVAAKERTFEESIFRRPFVLREKQEQSKKRGADSEKLEP